MEQLFHTGDKVRFKDDLCGTDTFVILATSTAWGIGQRNQWHGEYVVRSPKGGKVIVTQRQIMAAE